MKRQVKKFGVLSYTINRNIVQTRASRIALVFPSEDGSPAGDGDICEFSCGSEHHAEEVAQKLRDWMAAHLSDIGAFELGDDDE